MSKRKNPLKDLEAFLKQEAKQFVEPNEVKKQPTQEVPASKEAYQQAAATEAPLDEATIKKYLIGLEQRGEKDKLYTLVQEVIESSGARSSEDKMLINTLIYLKDKKNWKKNILHCRVKLIFNICMIRTAHIVSQ